MNSSDIEYRLRHCLKGKLLWKDFAPYRKLEVPDNKVQKAAVAVHIKLHSNEVTILLIERSKYKGKHSQQIAFPGGKMDESDADLEATARRESQEEVGFGIKEGTLLGCLSNLYIPVSNFLVSPFVFYHQEFPQFVQNEREVNSIMTCRMSEIDTTMNRSFKDIRISKNKILKNVPGIYYKEHFVWGATVIMLHEFISALKTS